MHLTTKLFLAATLLAGNLFASFCRRCYAEDYEEVYQPSRVPPNGPEENDIRGERGSGT